jgi:hypothetical protein
VESEKIDLYTCTVLCFSNDSSGFVCVCVSRFAKCVYEHACFLHTGKIFMLATLFHVHSGVNSTTEIESNKLRSKSKSIESLDVDIYYILIV